MCLVGNQFVIRSRKKGPQKGVQQLQQTRDHIQMRLLWQRFSLSHRPLQPQATLQQPKRQRTRMYCRDQTWSAEAIYRGFLTRMVYLYCISPDQNGVSLLYIMLETHHSGWEPSIYSRVTPFWSGTLDICIFSQFVPLHQLYFYLLNWSKAG